WRGWQAKAQRRMRAWLGHPTGLAEGKLAAQILVFEAFGQEILERMRRRKRLSLMEQPTEQRALALRLWRWRFALRPFLRQGTQSRHQLLGNRGRLVAEQCG